MATGFHGATFLLLVLTIMHQQTWEVMAAQASQRFENIGVDNVVFADDKAFEFAVRSRIECSELCAQFPGCMTFTFTKGAPLGSCRGHLTVMVAGKAFTAAAFSKTYKVFGAAPPTTTTPTTTTPTTTTTTPTTTTPTTTTTTPTTTTPTTTTPTTTTPTTTTTTPTTTTPTTTTTTPTTTTPTTTTPTTTTPTTTHTTTPPPTTTAAHSTGICNTSSLPSLPSPSTPINPPAANTLVVEGTAVPYTCSVGDVPRGVVCMTTSGWSAPSYQCGVCNASVGIAASGAEGVLYSPGYPNDYRINENCTYTVTVTAGAVLIIANITYNLELDYDYVELSGDAGNPLTGTGSTVKVMAVSGNTWTARFHTDASITKPMGWMITYRYSDGSNMCLGIPNIPNAVTTTAVYVGAALVGTNLTLVCNVTSVPLGGPVTTSSICQGNNTWTMATLSCGECLGGKTFNVTGDSGKLYSPGYPNNYGKNLNCTISVYPLASPSPLTVHVNMTYDLESTSTCNYDWVQFNGQGTRYCGAGTVSILVNVTNGRWFIGFESDNSITKAGFTLTYYP